MSASNTKLNFDTPTPTTFELLFAQTGGRLNPRLAEACELWGISAKTYRNRKSLGTEPFLAYGYPMRVDLRDLASAIDANRAGAKAAPRIVASASAPKKRGRPTKAEQARRVADELHRGVQQL